MSQIVGTVEDRKKYQEFLTEDAFNDWKNWTITQAVMSKLAERRDVKKERMIELSFGTTKMDDYLQVVKLSGFIVGMNEFLELTFADLMMDDGVNI